MPVHFSARVRDAHNRLKEAAEARKTGKVSKAIKICESLIDDYPDYVGALHTLGLGHMTKGAYWPALSSFIRAAMLNPGDWTILTSLSQAYLGLGANEMAAHTLEQARAIHDDDAEIHFTLGLIYDRQREYELAEEALQRAVDKKPGHVQAALSLGHCQVHLGDLEAAAKSFAIGYQADPQFLSPIAAAAQLPNDLVGFDIEEALSAARPRSNQDQKDYDIRMSFTQAHLLSRKGDVAGSWKALRAANGPIFEQVKKDLPIHLERRAAISKMAQRYQPNHKRPNLSNMPVSLFVLGISRSGKTTMERLLSSVAGVKRGYENPIVELAVRRTAQEAGLLTMSHLGDLPPELDEKFVSHYTAELRMRAANADIFTNTHPERIADVGRLANLIPNMRFLFVVRNREDTALRIYMKHFREGGNIYAYDIRTILAELDWYHDLIRHWQTRFPEICRTIKYETMIEQPERVVENALELCGLTAPVHLTSQIGDDRDCAAPFLEFIEAESVG